MPGVALVSGLIQLPDRLRHSLTIGPDTRFFVPPMFGVTVLGSSHGFDPKGSTSGCVGLPKIGGCRLVAVADLMGCGLWWQVRAVGEPARRDGGPATTLLVHPREEPDPPLGHRCRHRDALPRGYVAWRALVSSEGGLGPRH
jgi:hypothetical protein